MMAGEALAREKVTARNKSSGSQTYGYISSQVMSPKENASIQGKG